MPSAAREERPAEQSHDSATDVVDLERYRRLRGCTSFYDLKELEHPPSSRRNAVFEESSSTRRCEQTSDELLIGAKLAWRNHARCVCRKHCRHIELIDARDAVTADALADAGDPDFPSVLRRADMAIRPNFVVRAKSAVLTNSGNGCPVL